MNLSVWSLRILPTSHNISSLNISYHYHLDNPLLNIFPLLLISISLLMLLSPGKFNRYQRFKKNILGWDAQCRGIKIKWMLSNSLVVDNEDGGGGGDGGVCLNGEFLPSVLYWPRASSGALASSDFCQEEAREEGRFAKTSFVCFPSWPEWNLRGAMPVFEGVDNNTSQKGIIT